MEGMKRRIHGEDPGCVPALMSFFEGSVFIASSASDGDPCQLVWQVKQFVG